MHQPCKALQRTAAWIVRAVGLVNHFALWEECMLQEPPGKLEKAAAAPTTPPTVCAAMYARPRRIVCRQVQSLTPRCQLCTVRCCWNLPASLCKVRCSVSGGSSGLQFRSPQQTKQAERRTSYRGRSGALFSGHKRSPQAHGYSWQACEPLRFLHTTMCPRLTTGKDERGTPSAWWPRNMR